MGILTKITAATLDGIRWALLAVAYERAVVTTRKPGRPPK